MHAAPTHAKRPLALLVVMLLAELGTGCAIRSGGPARQAAYDYSDHQHYNRQHARSPAYRTAADDAAARQLPWTAVQRYGVRDSGAAGAVGAALGYVSTALIAPPTQAAAPAAAEAEGRGHRPSPVEAGRAPAPRPQGRQGRLPASALRRSFR